MAVARLALTLFLVTQICDGIFTLAAVENFGLAGLNVFHTWQ